MAPRPKLSDSQKAEIRARKAADPSISQRALAAEFGVVQSKISEILAEPAEQAQGSALATATHGMIHRNPANPRRLFKPEALEEMAVSVAEKGILAPLLVRPHPTIPAAYELIAGERRWRGAGIAIERKTAAVDFPIPIIVRPCDDREALDLAMLENLQRQDMTPLEEAEGYLRMVEMGDTPADIERKLGVNRRTVQKRLRLVKDLTPKVRDTLAAGEISVEFANVLAAYCRKSHQDDVLTTIKNGWYRTSASLKESLLQHTIPEDHAAFDTGKYSGPWAVDEETGKRFFADPDQFRRLQVKAAKTLAGSLQKEVPWVEIWDAAENKRFSEYGREFTKRPDHPMAGAVIAIASDGKMEVHQGLMRTKDLEAEKRVAEGKPAGANEPMTKGHYAHAHRRKTAALQNAVAASPMMAVRLAILALMRENDVTKITADHIGQGEGTYVVADGPRQIIDRNLPSLMPSAPKGLKLDGSGLHANYGDKFDGAAAWRALVAMPVASVLEFFAALVALRSGAFDGYDPTLGDRPVTVAVAETLGLVGNEDQAGLNLQVEDLDGVRKDTLFTVARAAEVEGDLAGMKTADLKQYIANMAKPGFVVPSLRFGEKKDLEAMVAGKPHPKEVAEAISKSSNRFGLSELLSDQLQDWDPSAKLDEIAHDLHEAKDFPGAEEDIRTALVSGINALQRRPLDRRIADTIRFDPQEINVGAQVLIDSLFEIHRKPEAYQDIGTLGDAVAFVCDAFGIERASRAAQ